MAMISKRTGKMYHSTEEYLDVEIAPAFERIRRYEKISLNKDTTNKIHNQESLAHYIKKVTGKDNEGLVRNIAKTEAYQQLKADNKVEQEYPVSYDKNNAKQKGLVFVGRTKKGTIYAYNYKTKKMVSPKKYKL